MTAVIPRGAHYPTWGLVHADTGTLSLMWRPHRHAEVNQLKQPNQLTGEGDDMPEPVPPDHQYREMSDRLVGTIHCGGAGSALSAGPQRHIGTSREGGVIERSW